MMNFPLSLSLASKSPRRQYLLQEAGFEHTVVTIDIEETYPENIRTEDVPRYLANKKAEAYLPRLADNELVITADTVVVLNEKILGKPKDKVHAKKLLSILSGQTHKVITGVCLASKKKKIDFDDTTMVTFKRLTESEIDYYVERYKPYDKAGAYGAQEWMGMIAIQRIEGSYFNVMGLPVHLLYEKLNRFFKD
jgi:septum formation protein